MIISSMRHINEYNVGFFDEVCQINEHCSLSKDSFLLENSKYLFLFQASISMKIERVIFQLDEIPPR